MKLGHSITHNSETAAGRGLDMEEGKPEGSVWGMVDDHHYAITMEFIKS